MIEISSDLSDVERRLGALSDKANLVMSRAANRSATTAKTTAKKEVANRYLVKQKDVEETTKVIKANVNKPYAQILFSSEHENLFKFMVRPTRIANPKKDSESKKKSKKPPEVYKASVKRNTGVKQLKATPKPFVAKAKNDFVGVFVRKHNSRKIRGVSGPSVTQMVGYSRITEKIEKNAAEMLEERLEHEIAYTLR